MKSINDVHARRWFRRKHILRTVQMAFHCFLAFSHERKIHHMGVFYNAPCICRHWKQHIADNKNTKGQIKQVSFSHGSTQFYTIYKICLNFPLQRATRNEFKIHYMGILRHGTCIVSNHMQHHANIKDSQTEEKEITILYGSTQFECSGHPVVCDVFSARFAKVFDYQRNGGGQRTVSFRIHRLLLLRLFFMRSYHLHRCTTPHHHLLPSPLEEHSKTWSSQDRCLHHMDLFVSLCLSQCHTVVFQAEIEHLDFCELRHDRCCLQSNSILQCTESWLSSSWGDWACEWRRSQEEHTGAFCCNHGHIPGVHIPVRSCKVLLAQFNDLHCLRHHVRYQPPCGYCPLFLSVKLEKNSCCSINWYSE